MADGPDHEKDIGLPGREARQTCAKPVNVIVPGSGRHILHSATSRNKRILKDRIFSRPPDRPLQLGGEKTRSLTLCIGHLCDSLPPVCPRLGRVQYRRSPLRIPFSYSWCLFAPSSLRAKQYHQDTKTRRNTKRLLVIGLRSEPAGVPSGRTEAYRSSSEPSSPEQLWSGMKARSVRVLNPFVSPLHRSGSLHSSKTRPS